jgi:small subunit ribosomal protein S2
MSNITLEDLLKAGAHFGHKVSRWNPKMAPYIFTVRNKFHIIDLEKTHEAIVRAQNFVRDTVKAGGTVLFVGTKKQARDLVKKYALACGMPYVTTRWLGGTLTNFKTIQRSIRKLAQLEELLASEDVGKYTKKERLMMEREVAKNTLLFEGIRNLKRIPEVIFAFDTCTDMIAIKEAQACRVKLVGLVDTNSDPKGIDYPIPANDDALKTLDLIAGAIAEAASEGRVALPPIVDNGKNGKQ